MVDVLPQFAEVECSIGEFKSEADQLRVNLVSTHRQLNEQATIATDLRQELEHVRGMLKSFEKEVGKFKPVRLILAVNVWIVRYVFMWIVRFNFIFNMCHDISCIHA